MARLGTTLKGALALLVVLAGVGLGAALVLAPDGGEPTMVVALPPPPEAPDAAPTDVVQGNAGQDAATVDDDAVAGIGDHDAAAPAAADEAHARGDVTTPSAAPAAGGAPAPQEPARPAGGAPPEQVVVVATGLAWNEEFARSAAIRLPPAVVFALPADLPDAKRRLDDWQAAGRDALVRFAWSATASDPASSSIPLDGLREAQAARMEAQWRALDQAAGALIVEPAAATALAPVALSLADTMGLPVLPAAADAAPPPAAWRLDPALLGATGLEEALARVGHEPIGSPVLVVLVEIYPRLLDEIARWIHGLDEAGVRLARIDALEALHP